MFGADGGAENLHDEYLSASLKKQAEQQVEQQVEAHIDVWEMDAQYGVRDKHGKIWVGYSSRADAEEFAQEGDTILERETVRACTEWREATPHGT